MLANIKQLEVIVWFKMEIFYLFFISEPTVYAVSNGHLSKFPCFDIIVIVIRYFTQKGSLEQRQLTKVLTYFETVQ